MCSRETLVRFDHESTRTDKKYRIAQITMQKRKK